MYLPKWQYPLGGGEFPIGRSQRNGLPSYCELFFFSEISKHMVTKEQTTQNSGGSRISRRGGVDLIQGGRGPPRRLRFENVACQNERIWTRRGGARPP